MPWVFCWKGGDETGGVGLGRQRGKRGSMDNLPIFPVGVACGLAGNDC